MSAEAAQESWLFAFAAKEKHVVTIVRTCPCPAESSARPGACRAGSLCSLSKWAVPEVWEERWSATCQGGPDELAEVEVRLSGLGCR